MNISLILYMVKFITIYKLTFLLLFWCCAYKIFSYNIDIHKFQSSAQDYSYIVKARDAFQIFLLLWAPHSLVQEVYIPPNPTLFQT